MSAALLVTYPATAGARFDHDYYRETHLPLVESALRPHGLTSAVALRPEAEAPHLAVAILTFADAATRDAALGSPEAGPVFADIANFTDVAPVATPCEVVR
ncbi:EthD family reductase [Sphingomonas donggukensis]|uniref:EthD family reductase n=1 Tax=Sphingomonas donggukensis TaxID=2949093 RepID=A0ABY4TVD2_9SPHN|nr:EthD family reductase [Sphingomonas donggukensis]URW76337.1 EthD family reductase [Sphingomonas donggukensis]